MKFPRCPFCCGQTAEIDMPDDMKGEHQEPWLMCVSGCWIDGVGIPASAWPRDSKDETLTEDQTKTPP